MNALCRLLFILCALALASATSFMVGQFDERAAWLEKGPACVNLVLQTSKYEVYSGAAQVLEYGGGK